MNQEKFVLIAEDDEADLVLMGIVINQSGLAGQMVVTRDGEETMDYLLRRGKKFRDLPVGALPALLLLDLKLPKLSGLEVLRLIRGDERLQAIPVVIFTSSLDEKDKTACLAAGANEFVIKPINFDAYSTELARILRYYTTAD